MREDARRSHAKVLADLVWTDLRRGWRYTNPSLSVLKLVDVEFIALDDIAQDREALMAVQPALGDLDAAACKKRLKEILDAMLDGLAVSTAAPDLIVLDTVR